MNDETPVQPELISEKGPETPETPAPVVPENPPVPAEVPLVEPEVPAANVPHETLVDLGQEKPKDPNAEY